jgi:hypothetical protein
MNGRVKTAGGKRHFYRRTQGWGPPGLAAVNYYLLVVFVSLAVFFFVWAVLNDGYDRTTPLIGAVMSAVGFAASLLVFREVVLKRSHERAEAARRLSFHLREATRFRQTEINEPPRLSLEQNDALLREIRAKSDAAKVLGKFPEGHREVFELCDRYLRMASVELERARAGSPRIPAIRRGTVTAVKRHRFHLLKWAEIKAGRFNDKANSTSSLAEKMNAAEEASQAVGAALRAYPDEPALVESKKVLEVFLSSASVRASIELAEMAEIEDELYTALGHYRDALVAARALGTGQAQEAAVIERLSAEIARLEMRVG